MRLFKDKENAIIAGVCAGIAKGTEIDVVIVRLLFVLSILASFGTTLLVYLILMALMPKGE